MSRRITDERILMERIIKMLPKDIPSSAIESVECDPYDGSNGGGSYWVYLHDGYICTATDCHTLHEDTLAELKYAVQCIERWENDPSLTKHNGYTKYPD